ncbi:MFS transporter [Nonomuraea basaltis]|uniref:MFS transporter n=1 Tax=Nonomuraea basaltis TaxID=2495887 RepID=UPI001F118724|nr:MFS transporter [Nonomuraea basaltis]
MHEQDVAGTHPRAGRREWIGLAVLALPALLVALDIGVLFLALPHLSADLRATGAEQLWIMDSYGFLLAGFLITMGSLGDRVGRRRLLLIGAAAFGAASVLAAYASSPQMLIVARGMLGIAGATLGPSTLALISNMFADARQRGLAFSVWAACQFGGGALGPVIGGVMLNHFWWGSAFLLGVPVMVLLLVVGPVLLPEYRVPGAGRIDLFSVALSLLAVLPVVYGIKELAAGDNSSPAPAIVAIVAGVIMGALFVLRQRRLEHPLVDLRLFVKTSFRVMLTAMALGSGALAGISLLTSQYVQSVVGLSPAEAGLWQAPTGVGIAAGVLLAPKLVTVVRPTTAIVFGLSLSAVGMLLLTQLGSSGGLVFVVVCVALVAFGIGPMFALGTGLVVSSAPPERAGSAASLSETSNVLGSTLGLAILGTVGTAIYRNQLVDSAPAGVPAAVVGAARETMGGVAAAVGQLPAGPASELFATARESFTSGLNVVAAVGAVVIIGVAFAVRVALRQKAAQAEEVTADAG